jgi:hypothetical protein
LVGAVEESAFDSIKEVSADLDDLVSFKPGEWLAIDFNFIQDFSLNLIRKILERIMLQQLIKL